MFKTKKLFLYLFASLLICFSVLISLASDQKKEQPNVSAQQTSAENSSASEGPAAEKVAKDADGLFRTPTEKEDKALSAELKNTLRKYPKSVVKTGPHGELSLVVAGRCRYFAIHILHLCYGASIWITQEK
jgi:hypothetical protein